MWGLMAENSNGYGVLVGKADVRDNSEELDLDGKVMKIDVNEIQWIDLDCVHLAKDTDKWQLTFGLHTMRVFSWLPLGATDSESRVCS